MIFVMNGMDQFSKQCEIHVTEAVMLQRKYCASPGFCSRSHAAHACKTTGELADTFVFALTRDKYERLPWSKNVIQEMHRKIHMSEPYSGVIEENGGLCKIKYTAWPRIQKRLL